MLNKNFTCCFTGHRKISAANQLLLRGKIKTAVLSLIEKGAARLGIDIIKVAAADGRDFDPALENSADRII